MTAIAIWCNGEVESNPGLWIAADSRVVTHDHQNLIEDAARFLAIPWCVGRPLLTDCSHRFITPTRSGTASQVIRSWGKTHISRLRLY